MKTKRLLSLLLVIALAFGSVQAMCGFVANAIHYDYSVLAYMVENPTNYREDRYTPESFAFYKAALTAAEEVYHRAEVDSEEYHYAVSHLAAAEAALTYVGSEYHSALNLRFPDAVPLAQTVQVKFKDAHSNELSNITATAEYANIGDFYPTDDGFYTANVTATGATGTTATITVSYVLDGRTYTFNQYFQCIDAAAQAETTKAQLGAMIALENARNRQAEDYSGGFQAYQNVIKGATVNFANPTTTQTKIDRAIQNINMAINDLVNAYADYSEVYALVARANELNPDDYNSFTAVTQALDLIVYDYPASQQNVVDAMAEKLRIALDTLQLKVSRYTVRCITIDENGLEKELGSKVYDGTRTYVVRVVAPVYPGYQPDIEYQTLSLTADEHLVTFVYEPVTYYAYFNANGGNVAIDSIELTYDAEYGELPVATRDGYAFLGWFSDPVVGEQIFAETMVTINYVETLYAHWSDVETYTFNFDSGLGSACDAITASYGDAIEMPVPYLYGQTFLGWFYADGTAASYSTMPDIGEDGDAVTLYAKYEAANYDVTLDAGEGTVSDTAYNVTYGKAYGEIPAATREGYTFNGWFTQAEGGEQITAETVVSQEAAHTLYAQYTVNKYTLAFDMDGGNAIESITADYGTVIEIPEPTKKDYLFAGWTLDGQEYTVTTMPAAATVGGTTTIKAVWTLNTHISYYLDAYKTVNGVRVPATTIKAGDAIELEVSAKSNFTVGQLVVGIIWDKTIFQLEGTTVAKAVDINKTSDYYNSLSSKTFVMPTNGAYGVNYWAKYFEDDSSTTDVNEADPIINRTDFQCTRVQCGDFNSTTNTPVVLAEKTRIFTLKMKVKATLPADAVSGLITIDGRTFRGVENNTTAYPFYVSNPELNSGKYSRGDTINIINNFDNARLELEIGEDEEIIALTPAQGSTTVVDTEKGFVYGLAEELTFAKFKSDYASVIGTATVECADTVLKTGSVIKLVKDGVTKVEYTVVIYGDIDSDGIADGNDSFLVNMIVSGMLSADALTAAQKLAADPNHDGKIDNADSVLLADAGLLKATVSQLP